MAFLSMKNRWVRRTGGGIVLVTIVLAVVWTVWNWVGTRRVEEAVASLRAAGLPGTLAEIPETLPGGPPPSVEENAAPIYSAAFALIESVEAPEGGWWNGTEDGRFGFVDELKAALPRYEPAFEQLHRAAERPRCRFDLEWSDGFAMLLPHLSGARDAANLLATRALVRHQSGDEDGVLDDLHALFAIGRAFREEPILISQLVRMAVDGIGLDVLETVLPSSPDPLAAVEKVNLDDVRGGVSRAFGTEAVVSLSVVFDATQLQAMGVAPTPFWFFWIARPSIKTDGARLCQFVMRMSLAAREPYTTGMPKAAALQKEAEEGGGYMTKLLLPAIAASLDQEAEHVSRTTLAKLAAHCLAYRSEHGTYPSSIEDIPEAELDPLTGKPFLLESAGGGQVLKSAGSGKVRWSLPAN